MDVIPAIDLLGGEAVRLRQGRYDEVTRYGRPTDLAQKWSGKAPILHVVDLEGARAGRAVQEALVRSVADTFEGDVQVGGGIRNMDALESYFALGVRRGVIGTAAIKDPAFLKAAISRYPDRIVVALDAKDGVVATEGWETHSGILATDFAMGLKGLPIAGILYTDIARDGTEVGPNVPATAELASSTGLPVIASGGVGTLEHLLELANAARGLSPGITGAIVGKALLEGRFGLSEAIRATQAATNA